MAKKFIELFDRASETPIVSPPWTRENTSTTVSINLNGSTEVAESESANPGQSVYSFDTLLDTDDHVFQGDYFFTVTGTGSGVVEVNTIIRADWSTKNVNGLPDDCYFTQFRTDLGMRLRKVVSG